MFSATFLFISLSATVAVTSGIKCYKCGDAVGLGNKDCNDPFDATENEDMVYDTCAGCLKTKTTTGDVGVVIRKCMSGHEWSTMKETVGSDDDCKEEDKDDTSKYLCTCDTDLCNGAPKIGRGETALMMSILALPLIVAAVLYG